MKANDLMIRELTKCLDLIEIGCGVYLQPSLSVMTYLSETVDKDSKDNANDFIFDDDYFEDSWGLHSNLLLCTYQVNAYDYYNH